MSELAHSRTPVELARIPRFENHQATAPCAIAASLHGRPDKIREVHVADEAPALVNQQHRVASRDPAGNMKTAAEKHRVGACSGDWLCQAQGGVGSIGIAQVPVALLLCA